MIHQLRSAQFGEVGRASLVTAGGPDRAGGLSRLVRVTLALYLIPALLIVLVVGVGGMLILTVARVLITIAWGPIIWPRTPVGPTSCLPSDLPRRPDEGP
jgi:hypothetical protein